MGNVNISIQNIRRLAHSIDCRINLFEGYQPKKTEIYRGELLFWRQVVSLYGLFADCDRVVIKSKNNNLLELMTQYDLIERSDYEKGQRFWHSVSNVRKWFCHNNNSGLFYVKTRQNKIEEYLDSVFSISTNKPKNIEDIKQKDWSVVTSDMERQFGEYLTIIHKGLTAWSTSEYKEDIIDDWITLFSKALFGDKELISNVLADIAAYEKRNQGIRNMSTAALANSYEKQIEGCFTVQDIKKELKKNSSSVRSNKEIVFQSIRNSHLI